MTIRDSTIKENNVWTCSQETKALEVRAQSIQQNDRAVVSIVLGSYNRKAFLQEAIESIRCNGITVPYEIIVVDGGSTDGSKEWLINQPDIITIVQHNRMASGNQLSKRRNWGYFMNLSFKCIIFGSSRNSV